MSDTLRERIAEACCLAENAPSWSWVPDNGAGDQDVSPRMPRRERRGLRGDVYYAMADAVLSVLHEAGEQGDGLCPDPKCATDHICGDGGCRMNTLLADMGHERWVDAWREAADWRDQYRADREDGVELLKDILAWNFEAIPSGFASRIEGYISRVERQSSPVVAGEQESDQ